MTNASSFAAPLPPLELSPSRRLREAYERYLPAMMAIPAEQLTPVVVDIPQAVTTAFGALAELKALRPRIVDELPRFDIERYDSIEGLTLATAHGHALYMAAAAPPEDLVRLNEQAWQLRETLFTDAAALARRGLIDGKQLTDFKGLSGYRNVAFELYGVATVLRSSWDRISNKTALTSDELDVAEGLADHMLNAVGSREQSTSAVAEAAQRRQRAFTLLSRAYDQARRVVSFLRWDEGDVDQIAPSLYAGRGGGKKKGDDKPAQGAEAQGQAKAPSPSEHASPAAPPSPAAPAHPAEPGLPTGDPFLR